MQGPGSLIRLVIASCLLSVVVAAHAQQPQPPSSLVLYHASVAWRPVVDSERSRPEVLLNEITRNYAGHVVVGRDLDVF
jgi:hypothetical protein